MHPDEIRGINEALIRICHFVEDPSAKPLNIVILAPPGGGKSTTAQGFAHAFPGSGNEPALKYLKFNASQYASVSDFRAMWEVVRLELARKPVLCFIDEFDVGHFRCISPVPGADE